VEIISTFPQSNVEGRARLTSDLPSSCDEAAQHGRLRRPFWMLGIFKIRNGMQRVMGFLLKSPRYGVCMKGKYLR
jgi:hypothetical protein